MKEAANASGPSRSRREQPEANDRGTPIPNLPDGLFASYRRKVFGPDLTAQLNGNNVLGVNSDQGNRCTWPRKTEPRQYVTVDF